MGFLSLRDYGLIGNQSSAVLVSRLGSVDWCCLPYLDSPSHFGSLLDENQGGFFRVSPKGDFTSEQNYADGSNILETRFETPLGRGVLTDWMPVNSTSHQDPVLHRKVEVLEGQMEWNVVCSPRFGYGAERAQAERCQEGILFRGTDPSDMGFLAANSPLEITQDGRSAQGNFTLYAGESVQLCWSYGRERSKVADSPEQAMKHWQRGNHVCSTQSTCLFAGPWHDSVARSSLIMRLMSIQFSGALCESPTTSVPSLKGGSRNWDFRYAWLRDSSFGIQAFTELGHQKEADALFHWLSDIVIRDGAETLQSVYTLDGGRFLPERELVFLTGYGGAKPVRAGNIAARQFQLDIYGHVLMAAFQHYQRKGSLPELLWPKLSEIAEYICQAWRRPDRGPWEVRSKSEHFVASKVMCWVALDRAIQLARMQGLTVPPRWLHEAATVHRMVCEQGFDQAQHSFVRAFGEREIDASALLIPLVGFLPPDDERVLSTLDAVQKELSDGVLIHRSKGQDGLPEADGAHLLTSFWFVSCLALCGRTEEASDRLAELCTYSTNLGLFGEQIEGATGEPAGNFPSTSSHSALINASIYVGVARGRKPLTPSLIGLQTPALIQSSPNKRTA